MAKGHNEGSFRGKKKAKEIRRREKLEAKEDRLALRRSERAEAYRGQESQFDPTSLADPQPPPMLGTVARIVGEIG
jgi:hypothetical protein